MLQSDRFTWSMGKNTFASSPECCIRRDVYPDFSDPYQQELLFLLNLFDLRVVMVKDLIIVSLSVKAANAFQQHRGYLNGQNSQADTTLL